MQSYKQWIKLLLLILLWMSSYLFTNYLQNFDLFTCRHRYVNFYYHQKINYNLSKLIEQFWVIYERSLNRNTSVPEGDIRPLLTYIVLLIWVFWSNCVEEGYTNRQRLYMLYPRCILTSRLSLCYTDKIWELHSRLGDVWFTRRTQIFFISSVRHNTC